MPHYCGDYCYYIARLDRPPLALGLCCLFLGNCVCLADQKPETGETFAVIGLKVAHCLKRLGNICRLKGKRLGISEFSERIMGGGNQVVLSSFEALRELSSFF